MSNGKINNETELKAYIEEQLRTHFTRGLSQGSKAICGVVLEKAKANSGSAEEKIADIVKFCEVSLGLSKRDNGEQRGENNFE